MGHAICFKCIEDHYLKEMVEREEESRECSLCGTANNSAITVVKLGEVLEPVMREHFSIGEEMRRCDEDDNDWWEQDGEPMSYVIQTVMGQYFEFEDEIISAVIDAEGVCPQDGEEGMWDSTFNYVEKDVEVGRYYSEWEYTLEELKHSRRFFSPSANDLFNGLFKGVESLRVYGGKKERSVVRTFKAGLELYRARVCNTYSMLVNIYDDPFRHVGPPPKEMARAGRMNAEGVTVLYGAREEETCLAEMRPALNNDLAIIALKTVAPLRLLDFSRLERAYAVGGLSYFQPDFNEEVEKGAFLRRLHRLISQPIIPGRESDYLITQTMSEYLAYVHRPRFDGILFSSAQRANGTNVVLFASSDDVASSMDNRFKVEYTEESVRVFTTKSIEYTHSEVRIYLDGEGRPQKSVDWDE